MLQKVERSPVDLTDVLAFARVVETGGFARAAERLGLSKSIVSRRVTRLEAELGAKLLVRTARGALPTDIGARYYARLSSVFAELEAAHEAVAEAVAEIAGPIRITGPVSFGALHLAPALAEFAARHPRVRLDVSLDDKTVDLAAGGFDLAVRLGRLPDSALIARKLTPTRNVVVAGPGYLARRGAPARPAELSDHDLIVYANTGGAEWRFQVDDQWETVRGEARLRADSGDMLAAAVAADLGIAVLPTFLASAGLADGRLKPILTDFPMPEGGLYAVMPPGRATTARVRALVDFLAARFGPEPAWDPCWEAERGR